MTSHLLSVTTLLVVGLAPLPMLLHILSGATVQSRVPALPTEKMLVLLVLWTVIQSSVVTLLGWIGYLTLVGLLVLEGALAVSGVWLIVRDKALSVRRMGGDLRERLAMVAECPPAVRWLLSIAFGVALLVSFRALTVPATDGDSLWYLLPRVAHWYQHATFLLPQELLYDRSHDFYPYTWNTLLFLALAPVGHDQFVLMPGVLAWLTLGLGTYALGRLVGGDRFGALFAALLVLLMPLITTNVQSAHNDLPLGAFFVASVYFTMHGWRYSRGSSLLLALICAAMMAGIKTSGLAYAALVAALSLYLCVANRLAGRPHPNGGAAGTALMRGLVVVFSLGVLAVGSWYVHNALVTGNPLGFVQISVFGRVLSPGEVNRDLVNATNLLHNVSLLNLHHWEILRRAGAHAFGFPGLVLAVLALAAPVQLFSRPRVRALLLPLLCVSLASFFMYIATPWSAKWSAEAEIRDWYIEYNLRYGFPFWGLVGAIAGAAIRARPAAMAEWSMVGLATLAATSVATEGWRSYSLSGLVVVGGAVFMFFAYRPASRWLGSETLRRLTGRRRSRLAWTIGLSGTVAVLVILITLGTAAALRKRSGVQDLLFSGISRFVDDLPADTRIGWWATPAAYYLYGKRLQHTVVYLPLQEHAATSDDLLRYLSTQPVDLIAIGPFDQERNDLSPVWTLMVEKRQYFERLHGEDPRRDVVVYRLR
jgi:Dolichyl-phosphate-mannose-protein mannosyltransferase